MPWLITQGRAEQQGTPAWLLSGSVAWVVKLKDVEGMFSVAKGTSGCHGS